MESMKFKAYAIANEIELNEIAVECGIPKKYTWEEPLVLQGQLLEKIIEEKLVQNQKVLMFAFGSIVFVNFNEDHTLHFINYLKSFEKSVDINNINKYYDDYELKIDINETKVIFTNEVVIVPNLEHAYPELIGTIIAKSVALERSEEKIKTILDNIEEKIEKLEKGKLKISNRELAKTISTVLRHEYNTIAYIMILDRPDVTWEDMEASNFYDSMSELFELNDRYEIIKSKTSILNEIIDGLSMISHSIKGLFVEWVIVLLIVAEVILMTLDLLK